METGTDIWLFKDTKKWHLYGVGVLFCKGLDPNITVKPDTEGGVLAVKAILYETELKIVSVYTPNAPVPWKAFYTSLWNYVTNDTNMVLGGDFNSVPDTALDKLGVTLLVVHKAWRNYCCLSRTKTWPTYGEHIILPTRSSHGATEILCTFTILRSQRDRFLHLGDTTAQSTSHIRACHLLDHNTVDISLVSAGTTGRGQGSMENELQSSFSRWNERLPQVLANTTTNHGSSRMVGQSQREHQAHRDQACVRKNHARQQQEQDLRSKLTHLQATHPDIDVVCKTKQDLLDVTKQRLEGAKIRSELNGTGKVRNHCGFSSTSREKIDGNRNQIANRERNHNIPSRNSEGSPRFLPIPIYRGRHFFKTKLTKLWTKTKEGAVKARSLTMDWPLQLRGWNWIRHLALMGYQANSTST